MVLGMATTKITITLPNEQIEEIRALVASGQTPNISAFVKHATEIALHDAAGWKEILKDALDQTGGPLTRRERAWADTVLSPRSKNRSKQTAA
jgi:Arc/MetJ-type ribon-helix-helix transcriptional regulator